MVHMEDEADALADAVEANLPGWVVRSVERLVGPPLDPQVHEAAAAAGQAAVADVVPELRQLLAADIDEQWSNPLAVVRRAVAYPTAVLEALGVPPVGRDDVAEAQFPDDAYDLTPASFAEIAPALAEPGLVWGAAKALAHRARHGAGAG
jgi:hypothetical protein